MASQADGLLVDSDLVGVDGGLLQNAALIDRGRLQNLLHLLGQSPAVFRQRHGAALLYALDQTQNGLASGPEIGLQRCTLHGTHRAVFPDRLVHHGQNVRRDLLLVLFLLFHDEHIGHPRQRRHGDVVRHAVVLRDRVQRREIALEHRAVERNFHLRVRRNIDRDEHVNLAARNFFLHSSLDRVLSKAEHARQLHAAIQIPVVDGSDLDRDLPAADRLRRTAVTGHTLDQNTFLRISRSGVLAGAVIPRSCSMSPRRCSPRSRPRRRSRRSRPRPAPDMCPAA